MTSILAASEPASKNTSEYVRLIVNGGKEPKLKNDKKQLNGHVPDFRHVGHIGSAFGRKFYWSKKSGTSLSRTGFRR